MFKPRELIGDRMVKKVVAGDFRPLVPLVPFYFICKTIDFPTALFSSDLGSFLYMCKSGSFPRFRYLNIINIYLLKLIRSVP